MALKRIVTNDGSVTFYNDIVNESYHSTKGALQEALEKHVIPSGVLDLAKSATHIVLIDVCFGLGYNTIVALQKILEINPSCFVEVMAFENDLGIIQEINGLPWPKEYVPFANAVASILDHRGVGGDTYEIETDTFSLTLFLGDVRHNLFRVIENSAQVIFFDPFSPKKQPELWSKELFDVCYSLLSKKGVLTTYSCARMVRDNMNAAGFKVIDGPYVGHYSPSTIATKP